MNTGQYGNTVLHYAVLYGRIEMAKFLIENEALDVNQRNDLSETPLHLASGAYNISVGTVILELLLKSGADLHAITAWGDTAAHYAALSGTLDSLQYLFEAGINLTKDKELESQAWKVCHSHQLSEECEETMKYDLLQKVARSSCINKSVYLINKMMDVRQKINANSCMPHFRRGGYIGTELNCQETQLLELSTVKFSNCI